MGVNEWIAVLGAIGGTSTITWLVTFWVNRKTNARKEDATADSMENENERKQVDWLEKRLAERDAKIDAIYVELRQEHAQFCILDNRPSQNSSRKLCLCDNI